MLYSFFLYIYFNANSVDPDQTPRSTASDLGLHCLPMSLLWVNFPFTYQTSTYISRSNDKETVPTNSFTATGADKEMTICRKLVLKICVALHAIIRECFANGLYPDEDQCYLTISSI